QAKSCVGTAAPGCPAEQNAAATTAARPANTSSSEKASGKATTHTLPADDELVVYEKGKVIFRMKPAPAKRPAKPDSTRNDSDSVVEASSTTRIATTKLAPAKPAPAKPAPAKLTTTKLAPTKIVPSQIVWL